MLKASYRTHTGKWLFSFGKYKGKSTLHILQVDPKYIKWVKEKTKRIFSPHMENEIKRINLI